MRLYFQLLAGFFFINVALAQHNPLKDPHICGLPECKGTGKFKYGPDTQQNYKYSVEVKSLFNGTSKNESSLYVEGTASLRFLTPCDGLLTLSDIKLSENIPRDGSESPEHANSQLFADMISEYPLRFAFKDGVISELCPRDEEQSWVLNFKRGVLSMLHNTMRRFDLDHFTEEDDVRGKCPTDYKVLGAKETSLLIEKYKDLDACESRSKLHSILQSTSVPFHQSNVKRENILKSSSQCYLSIDHNVYNEITCKEIHVLQPFSNQNAGASTIVVQKLILLNEEKTETHDEVEIFRRTSLAFDHTLPSKSMQGDIKTSIDLIKQLCRSHGNDIQMDFSDLFSRFIHSLRLLPYTTMSALYRQAGATCPTGKKHLQDALPFVSTGASVALMRDVILNESIPEGTANEWITSMAFIASPDDDMMKAVLSLLEKKTFTPNIALSVSSLAHTYCIQTSNCISNDAVDSIVQYLENYLREIFKNNSLDRLTYDNIMVTLKALSNIGVISEDFQSELFKVIENSNLNVGIRVAAVETFRRLPCEDIKSYFESIFRNQDEDSEIRIASYLQIMRCPNYLLIRAIRHALQDEEVNQVGSFIWTHLNNLLKSAVPSRVEIQSLLSEKDLVKKFSSDIRKYSHNFEKSIYFDEYDFGGNCESNVIFSTSSYIPRSAMLNITVDLFGESVNLLEVYGRAEGFEHYLESLFGPKGSSETVKDNIMDKVRWTRNARENEIIKSQVDELPNVVNSESKEPKVGLGLKIFGNELKYATFNGDQELREAVESLNPVYHLKRVLSGKEINYNKAVMFLDTNYVVPSGAGLPLSLNAIGTASINIKLHGSLQAAGFSKDKELELDLHADMQPTVSLDITGEMLVDAFYASTGIKLKTNMYTDSAIKAAVKIRGTKLVSAKFSLPKQKNEIFAASSELLVKKNGKEEMQTGVSARDAKSVCFFWPAVSSALGLKPCAEYNFVNVAKMENMPHFLLAGPAGFRWYLNKTDPTANIYSFEYRWTRMRDISVVSLTFDTPGSEMKTLLTANLTIDKHTQNLTMLLQSSTETVVASGKYKNTEGEKFVRVSLDINNRKHFDASVSLLRSRIRNGFSYKPEMYLGVNGDRVLGIEGAIDWISKKGISQYTVDLKFATKRLNSKLFGYISRSDSSLEVNLYNDYKFQHMKENRISFKFGVANRSRKNIFTLVGSCKLHASAYPNLNFASNATFQRSGGHMDLTVKLIQNPLSDGHPETDFQSLRFNLLFSYKAYTDNKRTVTVLTGVSRKSTNLALKGEFIYESHRHDINVVGVVKYGHNKQVSMTIFWSHPRSTLEQIRMHVNVTIPSFTPMIFKMDIEEKQPRDYKMDVRGTWFSGHSMTAVGFYQDKGRGSSSQHHVKLFLKSPSFKDVNIDLQFYRDNDVLKLDLKAIHNNNDYQLFFNHQHISAEETETRAKIKYKTKLYTFLSTVYEGEYKKINAELRIDQLRDINFSVWLYNQELQKAFGFEMNWDANRDPNQKLMISTNYTKIAHFHHVANFILSYPTRTIIADYKFLLEQRHINTLASVSWDDGRTLAIDLDVLYEYEQKLMLEFSTKLNTPFDNWKIMKLDGEFEHLNNKYSLNGVMAWDRGQRVAVDIFGDYTSIGSYFTCKYSCSIASSLDRIPNINTTLGHRQNDTNFDSILHLMYNPDFVIDLESQWKIDSDKEFMNLTGTIYSQTPFKGLNKGVLVNKIFLKNGNYVKGVAHMDLDNREMDINLEGKFIKITNCALVVNATTSEGDYQIRTKISTEQRHVVALLTYPTGSFGTEVLLSVKSLSNFHVIFYLATPVEFLQKINIVAKLKRDEADFRLGYNSLLLGFSGVWHYVNVTDFEYSYKIFTPILDFEENGIVGRLIFKDGLDFEVSIKLSNYKLGAKLVGEPKPRPFRELGINLEDIYLRSKLSEVEGKDGNDPLSWKGLIELDVIIYPTMKGELEIDQKGASYVLQSKLVMPHGVAVIFDELEYIDIFFVKNKLEISTPYQTFKTIVSNFDLNIQPGHKYIFGLNLDYQNQTKLIKTGVYAKYIVETKEAEERIYNVTVKVNTPFKAFPKLDLFGAFETEENFYLAKLLFNTNRSDISAEVTTEISNGLLELTSNFHATTPSIYVPPCQLRLTKLFSNSNNYVEITLDMPQKLRSEIYFRISWMIRSRNEFRSMIQMETPFTGMENTTAGVDVYISDVKSTTWAVIQMNPLEIDFNSTVTGNMLAAVTNLNFGGKRFPIIVDCTILKPTENTREFDGDLRLKDKLFKISANAYVTGSLPTRVSGKLTPKDGTPPLSFGYEIIPTSLNRYELVGNIQHADRFTRFNAYLTAADKFNWELNFEVDTNTKQKFVAHAKANSDGDSKHLIVNARTPIPNLEASRLGATYTASGIRKKAHGFFEVTKAKGDANVTLTWQFLENMYLQAIGKYTNIEYSSQSSVEMFYENPQKTFHFVKAGGDIRIDKLWEAGSNVTLNMPQRNRLGFEGHFKVPDDNKETHSLRANLDYTKNFRNVDYLLKYRTSYSLKKYGSWGQVLTVDSKNLTGDIEVEWNGNRYNNYGNFKKLDKAFDLLYKLKTPRFSDKRLLVTEVNYKLLGDRYSVTCEAFLPEDRSVAYGTVDYKELANMNGMFNVTVPHNAVNYSGAYFKTETNAIAYNRYIKVFWDGDNAVLDSKSDIEMGPTLLDSNMNGKLIVELPLATRHVALVDYKYNKKPRVSIGHATVYYNGDSVLEGRYNCLTEARAGLEKDTTHVELHNSRFPIGAEYVHRHEYDVPTEGYEAPSVDNKYLHLYHLQNRSRFNVTGELNVRTTWSGQEYVLTATHTDRSVKLWTDYDVLDMAYKQHSRLELSPSTWIEYDLNLFNRTVDDKSDVQQVLINVFYPRRNFTAQGFYNISNSVVSTDLSIVWDEDNKTVQAGLDWRRASLHREQLLLQIKHPSFERDVSFFSEYGYNKLSIDGQLVVDYSLNPDQKLTLGGKVTDNSNSITYNYTYNVWAEHNATNLNLNSRGDFYWNPSAFGTEHTTNYQRSYLPLSTSETLARINLNNNEIELKKDSVASGLSYFWGRYGGNFPIYTANMASVHGMNDTSGEFYLNLRKKLLYLNVNMTQDGSQSLHMYGFIPDARSAIFDIWRDYEDKRVSDVSYYLRLNHSRLLMSKLRWRPEMTADVQSGIRGKILRLYLDTLEGINNTKLYIRAEALDAINGVWQDSKPKIQEFLVDLRNLTVIEEDIEELRIFLNKSYYANDFYIKDITTVIVTMFDELALKSHLQSLPKIVQEIWSVMGESGQKLKKSVLWVIEKIKTYYKSSTDFIHGLINGDPIEHITKGLEKLVEKYDDFIKNVHVTILQYMESLWSQTYALIVEHWHKTLAAIEPTFLKFIHYLESIVWNTGKEFLDFLYLRKNEIMESPYFLRFTEFSHDLDKFYKDITGKNTIASIYKYANIAWKFLKEKYLHSIPFGKELVAIVNEIWTELKQIGHIPSVKYVLDKLHGTYESIKYYYDRFDIENKMHRLITLIYAKLSDMSVTALELENRHREAKTKFIFEPNDGIMLLEQKLPMSWHAFNETPKFKEIPEIKAIFDLQKYLEASQVSFWSLYYEYKPFMDPSDWLPPFRAHAMLVGSKYYVTFDKRYYDFQGSCTYLLATDFLDRNFTLLVSYDEAGDTNELILLLNKTIIRISTFTDHVHIGDSGAERLPIQIEDTYLYREADILIAESASGFALECNMKFHICVFEVSGWYFGKTAGLWGTFNNEPFDDFLTSFRSRENGSDVRAFGDSWALDKKCKNKVSRTEKPKVVPQEILALCDEFFTSKVSQLNTCFPRIPKDSFLSMCLNSTSEQEACMSAISYINLCSYANTPLRIPDTCVKCTLLNGTKIQEGDFIRLQGSAVPQTADIVFIVEAKQCNKDLKNSKNFESVIELLEKELSELNITDNRYAAVTFGGDGVYDEPRSVIVKGKTFTSASTFLQYVDDLPVGNGNKDIFNAIIFAYNMISRPGASRNFILIPCSDCNKYNMEHDYSTIHQLLSESAVSLHILMNEYFTLQKEREVKVPFGIDRRYAYTKKDAKGLVGDQPLRKSIILPKPTLGLCLSLAVETNGTVFSGKYLETNDKKNAKKFSTVFTKAVARKAMPSQCVDCECTAPNTGVSYMECYQCTMTNLTRNNIEQHILGLEDEDSFNNMNVFDGFSFYA